MINKVLVKLHTWFRNRIYKSYCNNKNVTGSFQSRQPVVLRGKGQISFDENVKLGVINSPHFYNSYIYIEARTPNSKISLGKNVSINNASSIVSEKEINIGNDVLIGYNCSIIDSNFHDLDPLKRRDTDPNPETVNIGDNVFIGNDVTILKGVTLGKNVVVAARSLVTKSFPENVIIAGCPAKVVSEL